MTRHLLNTAASVAGAITLAACGGGGSSAPPPPPPPPANVAPSAALTASAASVREGRDFTLDASGSSDPDGDPLSYSYRVVSGPDADLSGASGATPTVTAPGVDADGTLTVEVTISDGRGGSDTATVDVEIVDNVAPEAALSASVADVDEGQPLVFDAGASTDAEGDALTYTFVQIAGPDVDVSASSGSTLSIDAPEVTADALLTIEVQVDDGVDISTARVDVTVENVVLEPDAGLDETLAAELDLGDLELVEMTEGLGASDFYILTRDTDAGPLDLHRVRLDNDGGGFADLEFLIEDVFDTPPIRVERASRAAFMAVRDDGVDIVAPNAPGQTQGREVVEVVASLEADAPCTATMDLGETSAGSTILVGRDGGFSLYTFRSFDSSGVIDPATVAFADELAVVGSFCATSGRRFISTTEFEYLAFDADTNDVLRVGLSDDGAGGLTLSEGARDAVPNLPAGLAFVDGTRNGTGMAVALSDGEREGTHVAVNIRRPLGGGAGLDSNLIRWDLGIPSSLAFDFIEDMGRFLFILTPGVPYLVAVDDPGFSGTVGAAIDEAYVDVGLGASLYL